MKKISISAEPHNWPKKGSVEISKWALIIVDMQNDYCTSGCYVDNAGYDIEKLRKPIPFIQKVLQVVRTIGMEVIFTRHGSAEKTGTTASKGSSCYEIIKELKPSENEIIFDKTTISVFNSSDIDDYLKNKGIEYLAFCGNTIDCCVHSAVRSANDLNYKCLLLSDCCGALNSYLHKWSLESIKIENGVF